MDIDNNRCKRRGSCNIGESIPNVVKSEEGIKKGTWGLEGYPLASVYAPIQSFEYLLDKESALKEGTVFSKLVLPFKGDSVYKGGNCRG